MLGLFTAGVMFILSENMQDMDLNKNALTLLVNLLKDASNSMKELSYSQLSTLQNNAKQLCPQLLKLSGVSCPFNGNFTVSLI